MDNCCRAPALQRMVRVRNRAISYELPDTLQKTRRSNMNLVLKKRAPITGPAQMSKISNWESVAFHDIHFMAINDTSEECSGRDRPWSI